MSDEGLRQSIDRMRARGISNEAIRVFRHYYHQLEDGALGVIPEATIEPLGEIQRLQAVTVTDEMARHALSQTAIVKLNGGLGTTMGMNGAKSALPVVGGLSFLDIIAQQTLALRKRWGVDVPLIFMNSFRTSAETLEALRAYPDLEIEGVSLEFLQNAEPKLRARDLRPVDWPADPELEWCPPGHGDVFVSMMTSGLIETLLDRGIRYVFISNADNLGATCDPDVAGWMVDHDLPYVAEVCERTASDRKGGHLAVRKADGRLVLRDLAMVYPGEEEYFRDIERHSTFHANNIWINLEALDRRMAQRKGVLGLPIIINRKTVDPTDTSSTRVVQLESAMGGAIEIFERSEALLVPRTRFRPVKTTNDLLVMRSDFFRLDDDYRVVAARTGPEPFVDLDDMWFKLIPAFDDHFPHGVPSLRECTSLTVRGDVTFGRDVRCVGDVRVEGVDQVPDGTVLGEA
ncbi:UTP--glucose-1-phosphate uridylyltransferase [Intrasporangium chromatireducens Q5-1]|uniref:UTP--glucose-1-phosphate uridylyltransferase n=1 Tax=Intrasporangium chromatireducens Q5-1 TaxID=584657 RepID=W9GQQ9_9MICO|nr:UTP--glucose-1-phosphate uridylyltransferase [Intrasporangium chromatireducens]EWT07153.1 UTP--glucose-1-phosphate uridylyltransferase [Intrasporangium chromatireducens Q5-1]